MYILDIILYGLLGLIGLAIAAYVIMKFGVVGFGKGKEYIAKNRKVDKRSMKDM